MEPLYFKGQVHEKPLVLLIYDCTADGRDPVINEEFEAFQRRWDGPFRGRHPAVRSSV